MISTAVLDTSAFGYGWAQRNRVPVRSNDLFPQGDQENLNPKSLQPVITPEGHSYEVLKDEREQTELEANTVSLLEGSRKVGVHRAENARQADAVTLSETAIRILGKNGQRRFEEFTRYQAGWDIGSGAPLSLRSATILDTFLARLPGLAAYQPSLFLTHNGNLELGWEDSGGNAIEIEFWPDRIGYYFETLNEERSVRLEVFPQFIEKVRSLIS